MIFHVNTAEEYYSGILVLQELNGVTDGSIILYTVLIVAGTIGNDIFLMEVYNGWKIKEIIGLFVTLSQSGVALYT